MPLQMPPPAYGSPPSDVAVRLRQVVDTIQPCVILRSVAALPDLIEAGPPPQYSPKPELLLLQHGDVETYAFSVPRSCPEGYASASYTTFIVLPNSPSVPSVIASVSDLYHPAFRQGQILHRPRDDLHDRRRSPPTPPSSNSVVELHWLHAFNYAVTPDVLYQASLERVLRLILSYHTPSRSYRRPPPRA
ncbi:hypothetical protein OH76DRAFT_1486539 [Lentinus brumalis]|uniref:Uncharacterized protein n=1 Tax=Lentinus brumalis TaxID=2498619 RepID=A0A371CY77_9APHY|nr:hypothetical protein OH76DRAFT_1486539 [Polyporus brumalis]